jgi:mRNA interferase HigB
MRVIARRTLLAFWSNHADAEQPLKSWFKVARAADWATPADVRQDYRTASFLAGNRICFDIAGNKFRLIVRINYPTRTIFIRFIGTHAEYDKIDANTV